MKEAEKQTFSAVVDKCAHGHDAVRVDEHGEPYFWVDVDSLDQLIDVLIEIRQRD